MDQAERRARIRANLGIEPISHGQIYTFQIAVPESQTQEISPERHQLIEDSFTEHKSNLFPLIVRRTENYSEEEEYEIVYGVDWCIVAKELDIEKLWVWVFDMTDEQAAAAKIEMEQLLDSSTLSGNESPIPSLQTSSSQYDQIASLSKKFDSLLNTLKSVSNRIENLELGQREILNSLKSVSSKIENLESGQREILNNIPLPPGKTNLNKIKTAKELEQQKIPQLGPKRAEAIIKLRQQKGQFQSVSELLEVKGITTKMITQFAPYVCL